MPRASRHRGRQPAGLAKRGRGLAERVLTAAGHRLWPVFSLPARAGAESSARGVAQFAVSVITPSCGALACRDI